MLEFDRDQFLSDYLRVRKERGVSNTVLHRQTGICLRTLQRIEDRDYHSSLAFPLLAFWSDLDLRDYVKVNLITKEASK